MGQRAGAYIATFIRKLANRQHDKTNVYVLLLPVLSISTKMWSYFPRYSMLFFMPLAEKT